MDSNWNLTGFKMHFPLHFDRHFRADFADSEADSKTFEQKPDATVAEYTAQIKLPSSNQALE